MSKNFIAKSLFLYIVIGLSSVSLDARPPSRRRPTNVSKVPASRPVLRQGAPKPIVSEQKPAPIPKPASKSALVPPKQAPAPAPKPAFVASKPAPKPASVSEQSSAHVRGFITQALEDNAADAHDTTRYKDVVEYLVQFVTSLGSEQIEGLKIGSIDGLLRALRRSKAMLIRQLERVQFMAGLTGQERAQVENAIAQKREDESRLQRWGDLVRGHSASVAAQKRSQPVARRRQTVQDLVERVWRLRAINEQLLTSASGQCPPPRAFLGAPESLTRPRLLFARSLRQPNGWVCAPMALYTAYKVDDWLIRGQRFAQAQRNCFLDYESYNFDTFSIWYSMYIASPDDNVYNLAYDELGVEPLGNLLCPQPNITQHQGANFLNSEQIEQVAQALFGPNGYILLSPQALDGKGPLFVENTAAQAMYFDNDGRLPLEKSDEYLRREARRFFTDANRRGLYLFCNIGTHWFLVVVAKTGPNEAKMVVFDSMNPLAVDEVGGKESMSQQAKNALAKLYSIFIR